MGGILFTLGLTVTARVKSDLDGLSCSGFICILIGAGDFCTDIVFARSAWLRVTTLVGLGASYAHLASEFRLIALLATIFLVVPVVASTVPLTLLLWRNRPLIDSGKFGQSPGFYGILLVLALTNLEVLKLIPWRENRYDGFPTAKILGFTFFTTFVEDIPQAALQIRHIILSLSNDIPGATGDT